MSVSSENVKNYMIFSVLVTLLCCPPTGIVAIVYSKKVSQFQLVGDTEKAKKCSAKARTWSIVSLTLGILLALVYSVLAFMGAFTMYGLYY